MKTIVKSIGLGAVLAIAATAAHADTQGFTGQLVGLRINESSSLSYNTERGVATIHEGGGVNRKYQWGGQACNGRNLTEQNQNILARVVASGTVVVTPFHRNGVGGARCLVGFQLQDGVAFIE